MTDQPYEIEALKAYSEGKMGWREACRSLLLLDMAELNQALAENELPTPPPASSAVDEETSERMDAFLKAGQS